jgi:hypothetical protein
MFAVIKTFVTDISASTGRNDFIFDIWLLHGELYRVSPFQVYRTSTSCLAPPPLEWGYNILIIKILCDWHSQYILTSLTKYLHKVFGDMAHKLYTCFTCFTFDV